MDLRDERTIICGTHGTVHSAYVCCHINFEAEAPVGFVAPEPDAEDPELQAWCNACDKLLEYEGDWTEAVESFAGIRLVCEFCFAKLRELHASAP
jgi:hypothetical protein